MLVQSITNNFQVYSDSSSNSAVDAAVADLKQLKILFSELIQAANGKNEDEIQQLRQAIYAKADDLKSIVQKNPGDFSKGEVGLTGQISYYTQVFANTFDNFYTQIATEAGALFGFTSSLEIELTS